mgnify:CR=1 FL=1
MCIRDRGNAATNVQTFPNRVYPQLIELDLEMVLGRPDQIMCLIHYHGIKLRQESRDLCFREQERMIRYYDR